MSTASSVEIAAPDQVACRSLELSPKVTKKQFANASGSR
jgi:hypothetical protein